MLRNWQWIILAPLTLSVLTACPEHSHTKSEPTAHANPSGRGGSGGGGGGGNSVGASASPFTGYWIAEDAWSDYEGRTSDSRRFCQHVMDLNDDLHGVDFANHLDWNNIPHPLAFRIYASGDRYDWLSTMRDDSADGRGAYDGWIRDDGFFSTGDDRNKMQAADRQTYADANKAKMTGHIWFGDKNGTVDNDHLVMMETGGQALNLRRTSERELEEYTAAVENCLPTSSRRTVGQNANRASARQRAPVPQQGQVAPVQTVRPPLPPTYIAPGDQRY